MMRNRSPSIFPTIGRMVLGAIWIAGAIFNTVWTLPGAADAFANLGEDATFAGYRWFFSSVVGAVPELMAILLILGELALGVLLLARDPWAEAGLVLSVVWCAFLFFLIWPYTLTTLVLLALAGWLLRYDHQWSIVDLVRHRGTFDHVHPAGA